MNEHTNIRFLIVGAGIGGLAAAAELKDKGFHSADIGVFDKSRTLPMNLANGVHYMHTKSFGTPFPFEFKEVVATEEIWDPRKDEFKKQSHIPEMVDYSMKVMGLRHPSSIMDPGSRDWKTYLPLSNNMNDLLMAYWTYIGEHSFYWGWSLAKIDEKNRIATFERPSSTNQNEKDFVHVHYEHLITTAPLNYFVKMFPHEIESIEFKHQPVHIINYKAENIVDNWLICLYISDNKFPVYRITILNGIISMESLVPLDDKQEHIIKYHLERYFDYSLDSAQKYTWETGRIWGLDKETRESVVEKFRDMNIHLLGRFGCWDGKLTMDTTIIQAKDIINSIV